MCDTLCALRPGGALFAKNSDRPPGEAQLIETYPRRRARRVLLTQYLTISDDAAAPLLCSRPDWLWGFEHGVNEHRVAIGNEKVFTVDDPAKEPPALIGMDLVRLGLERARTAEDALDVMTSLLETHGQGGIANEAAREPYFSSFLITDPRSSWVLETSGRTWAAAPVTESEAITNRLTLRQNWTRASEDVATGADFDRWRDPDAPVGHADRRLAASRACLARGAAGLTAADMAAHLRDHGEGPWGAPGASDGRVSAPPAKALPDGTGVTVCMHIKGRQNTTSSMVAELPADPEKPLRAWVALGSPCASVFLPVFPPKTVPAALGDAAVWRRFAALRDRVQADTGFLREIRAEFGPLEAELWREADEVAESPRLHAEFAAGAWSRVEAALGRVEAVGAQAGE